MGKYFFTPDDKEDLIRLVPASTVALKYGGAYQARKDKGSRWVKLLCPFHEDRHLGNAGADRSFFCLACGARANSLDLLIGMTGMTLHDAEVELAETAGILYLYEAKEERMRDIRKEEGILDGLHLLTEEEKKLAGFRSGYRSLRFFLPEGMSYGKPEGEWIHDGEMYISGRASPPFDPWMDLALHDPAAYGALVREKCIEQGRKIRRIVTLLEDPSSGNAVSDLLDGITNSVPSIRKEDVVTALKEQIRKLGEIFDRLKTA